MPTRCPKCTREVSPELKECPVCGVIFAKARQRQTVVDQSGIELEVFEAGERYELVAILSCVQCQKVTRFTGEDLKPGASLFCPCGEVEGRLPVDDFDALKASLQELNAGLKNLDAWAKAEDEPEEDEDFNLRVQPLPPASRG